MTNVDDFTADRTLTKKKVASDGEVVRVPLMLMDSASVDPGALAALRSMTTKDTGPQIIHRPGPLATTDAARILRDGARSERDERIQRMNDAWRNPTPKEQASPQADTRPDPIAARAARIASMSDAWKGR